MPSYTLYAIFQQNILYGARRNVRKGILLFCTRVFDLRLVGAFRLLHMAFFFTSVAFLSTFRSSMLWSVLDNVCSGRVLRLTSLVCCWKGVALSWQQIIPINVLSPAHPRPAIRRPASAPGRSRAAAAGHVLQPQPGNRPALQKVAHGAQSLVRCQEILRRAARETRPCSRVPWT